MFDLSGREAPELLPWYLVVYLLGSWIGFQLVVPEMVAAVGPET